MRSFRSQPSARTSPCPHHFYFPAALLAGILTVTAVNAQTTGTDSGNQARSCEPTPRRTRRTGTPDARTPTDQSNDQDSRFNVTAGIRKAVLGDKSLSTSAHNIKIVTQGDVVTLRGPVASADEKKRVEALAMKAATGKQVRNEISVAR